MVVYLGLTTHQLLSTPDGVVSHARTRAHRLYDAVDHAFDIPTDEAAFAPQRWDAGPTSPPAPVLKGRWAASRRRRFPRTGSPCPWTAPTSTWNVTCPCTATSSTWAAAPSPMAGLRLSPVQRAHPGRGGRRSLPAFSRRRAGRDADRRPLLNALRTVRGRATRMDISSAPTDYVTRQDCRRLIAMGEPYTNGVEAGSDGKWL